MPMIDRAYIEISNICNLQCSFCPEVHREKKTMSLELFKKITQEVKPHVREVTFHLMGEPLSHLNFDEFVHHCQSIQLPVQITTNGTLIHRRNNFQALLNPIIRQVNFSLQSYLDNFPSHNLDEYLKPIFEFTTKAMKLRPDLYINYRLWNVGSREATTTANRIFLDPIEKYFNVPLKTIEDPGFKKSKNIVGRLYLHFDSRFEWPSQSQPVRSEVGYCYALKNHLAIHADGTVVACCLDKEAQLNLGHLGFESKYKLEDILNSPRAVNMKTGFQNKELREELCKRCDFIKRFDQKNVETMN